MRPRYGQVEVGQVEVLCCGGKAWQNPRMTAPEHRRESDDSPDCSLRADLPDTSVQFNAGTIGLGPLYQFAADNIDCYLRPRSIDGMSVGVLTQDNAGSSHVRSPVEHGVYLWGRLDRKGRWTNVYVGSTFCLQGRINEELRSEKGRIWSPPLGVDFARPKTMSRSWKTERIGCTDVVWIATPELVGPNLKELENEVIEMLNPLANRCHPRPFGHLRSISVKVVQIMLEQIHQRRDSVCPAC